MVGKNSHVLEECRINIVKSSTDTNSEAAYVLEECRIIIVKSFADL